MNLYSPR